ncbi:MAG: hypothetical protein NT118_13690 [Lentisphaerae bacterium]|nr:hypothetical protein [Lentisphaerota bacterium]
MNTYGEAGLKALREQQEKGLAPVFESGIKGIKAQLVILGYGSETAGKYTCLRYFRLGGDWQVSQDRVGVDSVQAFKWLNAETAKLA